VHQASLRDRNGHGLPGSAAEIHFTVLCKYTVSQKYVHPSPESIERAFERLETMNTKAQAALPGMVQNQRQEVEATRLLPTDFTTVEETQVDATPEVV
jgi:hypothetical protein